MSVESVSESGKKNEISALKKTVLFHAHIFSSLLHIGALLFIFIEWGKLSNSTLSHFQIICLVIVGIGALVICTLLVLLLKSEMKVESHARRFFHIWPLVHIALSTLYQLVTQVFVSHSSSYQVPSLYTAWLTTISVVIHLILHSISVFWE